MTPNQFLAGFQKVFIPYVTLGGSVMPRVDTDTCLVVGVSAGGSETVTIQINSTQLALWSLDNTWVVEPGDFAVKVGTSDTTYLNATMTVQ